MRMGLDGNVFLKPQDNGGLFGDGNLMPIQVAGDFYDEVNFTAIV